MLKGCFTFSSMRLGVPFIAPRQLGAFESIPGRQILPSVAWRTGQSGAHRTLSGARFLSLTGAADRWQPESRWRTGHVRCPFLAVGSATCPAQIARPTVGSPDSPVNSSRTSPVNSRERPVRSIQPGAPDTVRCTTGQSGAPRLSRVWLNKAISFPIRFFLFPALRHNTLVSKTMY
jgi:hypothetical protein